MTVVINGDTGITTPGPSVVEATTTDAALRITQLGTGNALLVEDSSNPDSSPFVIDTSGNVVVGSSTSVPQLAFTPQLQVHSTSVAGINVTRWVNSTAEPNILISKSRGASVGTYASVQSGDGLGILSWTGDDGTAFIQAASIRAAVDGTPGTNDMPGRLVFSTTADGASTPTERMRIDSSGNVGIGTSSPSCKSDVSGTIRSTSSGAPTSGAGVEIDYGSIAASTGRIFAFDRTGGTRKDMAVDGSNVLLYTGGSERMRIDSSGNVGIGTSSIVADAKLVISKAGAAGLEFSIDNAVAGVNRVFSYNRNTNAAVPLYTHASYHYWGTNAGNQTMTLDASGNLLVGTTSAGGTGGWTFYPTGSGSSPYVTINKTATSSTRAFDFMVSGTSAGSINWTNTATSYLTSSDYRLKENIAPMTGALSVVAQLKPVTYNWKVDSSVGQGFIAHELQAVVPDCVTGEKDAVDEDGNPVYQGIDTSFLVATLTAAIQEQQAIIEQLRADVEQLKGQA